MIKKKTIPWADPILDQKEITNVFNVFKSQRFTSGKNVKLLEKTLFLTFFVCFVTTTRVCKRPITK